MCAWECMGEGRWLAAHVRARHAAAPLLSHSRPTRPLPRLPPRRPLLGVLQLQQGEHAQAHALLELFAYGTWDDYKGGCGWRHWVDVMCGLQHRVQQAGGRQSASLPASPHTPAHARHGALPWPTPPSCSSSLRRPAHLRAADPSRFPQLSPAQQHKLKLLTAVSAADGVRTLQYEARRSGRDGWRRQGGGSALAAWHHIHPSGGLTPPAAPPPHVLAPPQDLMRRLELGSVRELEDLLIGHCFYAGLLKGKLDQKAR